MYSFSFKTSNILKSGKVSLSFPSCNKLFSTSYKACIYSLSEVMPSVKTYFNFVGLSTLSKANFGLIFPKASAYTK